MEYQKISALAEALSENIGKLATPDAAERVADEIVKFIKD